MGATQNVDYDALAQQAGGTVDYDSLAAKAGAVNAQHSQPQPDNYKPGFFSQLGSDLKGTLSAIPSMMGAMVGPTPVPLGGTRVGVSNPGGEMMSNAAEAGPAAQVVNKKGMEESAAHGDVAGVLGHE